MAVRISCRCFFIKSSIYQCFCCIHILFQIWVPYGLFFQQINIPAKQFLQRVFKIKVVVEIITNFCLVERNYQIHIAIIVKTVGKYRAKHKQLVYLVLLAQGNNLLYVVFYQLHKRTCLDCKDSKVVL